MNGPQTVSIAVGAILISVVDYRLLIALTSVVIAAAGLWLVRDAGSTEPSARIAAVGHGPMADGANAYEPPVVVDGVEQPESADAQRAHTAQSSPERAAQFRVGLQERQGVEGGLVQW